MHYGHAVAGVRLVIVTGKGGVGKTTVTAALGRAAARRGLRTLLVEMASPGRLAHVLAASKLGPEPQAVSQRLDAVALDADHALSVFVHSIMPLRALSGALLASDTFRIVAAAVPGIAEAAMLAQVLDWLEPRGFRRAGWDRIILDAPASGHSAPLFATPGTLGGIASVGPLAQSLQRISKWPHDPGRTTAIVSELPEAWAVAEALELHQRLRDEAGVPLARPVVNAVFPRRFTKADEERLHEAGSDRVGAPGPLAAARYFLRRREDEQSQILALRRGTGETPLELPFLFDPEMRLEHLDPIADALDEVLP